jgi:hypothetical protein
MNLQGWFFFSLKGFGGIKGHEIHIELASNTHVFWKPYKYGDLEWSLIHWKFQKLREVGLVELYV